MDGHEIVTPQENVQFVSYDLVLLLVESVGVQGNKEIAFIGIYLSSLAEVAAIFDTERMKLKRLLETQQLRFGRIDQVNPKEAALLNDEPLGVSVGGLQPGGGF
jgi:hypothetical protein